MLRVALLCVLAVTLCAASVWDARARGFGVGLGSGSGDGYETISGPTSSANFSNWYNAWQEWKSSELNRVNYSDVLYRTPELSWSQSSFVQPQVMVHDRLFFDRRQNAYTVDRFVDDALNRYGFVDSVLIWHSYPNIGVDDRSEFGMFESLPGGIAGITGMVNDFHARGIRVLFPYNPWDQGTAPANMSDPDMVASLWASVGADGFNGDTMSGIPSEFYTASVAAGRPLVLEPEVGENSGDVQWNIMGWGYWYYSWVPLISRYKWLESRFQVNVCNRWALNHTDDLQHAYFSGVGFEAWESIWGIWNQLTDRAAEEVRRIYTIFHYFNELVVPGPNGNWVPHTPVVCSELSQNVFASLFTSQPNADQLYLIINRASTDVNFDSASGERVEQPQTVVTLACAATDRFFDVYYGVEITEQFPCVNGETNIALIIEGSGYAAVYVVPASIAPSPEFFTFLSTMNELTAKPLTAYNTTNIVLQQHIIRDWMAFDSETGADDLGVGSAAFRARLSPVVSVPGAAEWAFNITGIEVEGPAGYPVDVQYPFGGETQPTRDHYLTIPIHDFGLDTYPVTNADFQSFLSESGYVPRDSANFLRHWNGGSTYPAGTGNQPVRWVDLTDATAFCRYAGKRLPHEWEWQYAAQYPDGTRAYPWGGDAYDPSRVPAVCTARVQCEPDDVDAHPTGASALGIMDLVGNIWQWTDAYADDRTAGAIVRGGTAYQPQGSMWYFPQSYDVRTHGKLLLMSASMDRSGGIGFRCATGPAGA